MNLKNFLKGIVSKLVCSCLMCKSEISTAFGSVFLSFRAMGIKAPGVGNKAQALFLLLQGTVKELGCAEWEGW